MKNIFIKFGGILASLALMITTLNINTACMVFSHQPKLPESAKSLRHF